MAFESYTDLQSTIAAYLSRSDLSARIPDFIRLAELTIQQRLRLLGFEAVATGTLTPSSELLALPSGCLEPRMVRIDTTPPAVLLRVSDAELVRRQNGWGGVPQVMVQQGTSLRLGPIPDGAYSYTITYQPRITPLGGGPPSNETNWLTQNAANVLLFGALCEAQPFIFNDERVALWSQKFGQALEDLRIQDWRARAGGGPITVSADVVA